MIYFRNEHGLGVARELPEGAVAMTLDDYRVARTKYFLTATGNGVSPDGTLPEGAVECSAEQYAAFDAWKIENGAVVARTIAEIGTAKAAAAVAAYKRTAFAALAASDEVWDRVAEGVALGETTWDAADVKAYATYRRELRAITTAAAPDDTKALPAAPPVPKGA